MSKQELSFTIAMQTSSAGILGGDSRKDLLVHMASEKSGIVDFIIGHLSQFREADFHTMDRGVYVSTEGCST